MFTDCTPLKDEVDAHLLLNPDGNAASHAFAEPREFDLDQVGARAYGRENVGSIPARHAGQRERLTFVCDGNRGAGQHAARLVFHGTRDRARVDLGIHRCGQQRRQGERQHTAPADDRLDVHRILPLRPTASCKRTACLRAIVLPISRAETSLTLNALQAYPPRRTREALLWYRSRADSPVGVSIGGRTRSTRGLP